MFVIVLQRLFIEALLDVVYFPIWWYTKGVLHTARTVGHYIELGNETLAPGLWLRNIFVPMFGQYDIAGKISSFFMRLFQIIFRSLALFLWIMVVVALGVVWAAWPVVVAYFIAHTLTTGSYEV